MNRVEAGPVVELLARGQLLYARGVVPTARAPFFSTSHFAPEMVSPAEKTVLERRLLTVLGRRLCSRSYAAQ